MNCTASSLAIPSACFACYSDDMARAIAIDLLCQWANATPAPPPATGLHWAPESRSVYWEDAAHPGGITADYATYQAVADEATLTFLDFNGDALITAITGITTLSALTLIDCSNTSITTLDTHGLLFLLNVIAYQCPNLNSIDCHGDTALTTLRADHCNLGTVTITGCVSLVTLILNNNPAVVLIP